MATVDEDHSQSATPESSKPCAGGHNGYDRAVDAGLHDIAPELIERIDCTKAIYQSGVVVALSGLMFF